MISAGGSGFLDDELYVGPVFLGEVVIDDDARFGVRQHLFPQAGELGPGAGIDGDKGVERIEADRAGGQATSASWKTMGFSWKTKAYLRGRWLSSSTSASIPFCLRAIARAAVEPRASPSGRTWVVRSHALAAGEDIDDLLVAIHIGGHLREVQAGVTDAAHTHRRLMLGNLH